jgi:ResB-like family
VTETSSASRAAHRLWDLVTSLRLTIVCLTLLMLLVVACTLAQVQLGTIGAVNLYMRSFVVWWQVPGTSWALAIFPGGATVGLVLMVNLAAAQGRRLELSWKKAGIWVVHAGLILLFVGEFVTGVFQVETQLAIEEGQTVNFVEHPRQQELTLIDTTDPAWDLVHSVPESLLAEGGLVPVPGTPLVLFVRRYWENAQLSRAGPGSQPVANAGLGASVAVQPLRPTTSDDRVNAPAAVVEPRAGGRSSGAWLVSGQLDGPQQFTYQGRTYSLAMRPRRQYLPYSMTLKKFSHDVYEGTTIPKNFSSLVHLSNPGKGESRDVLIYMNQPLRYGGKAFYQASFGKNDTLSILQVVENPGWLLPYISCALVGLGLMIHFGISLSRALRRRATAVEA